MEPDLRSKRVFCRKALTVLLLLYISLQFASAQDTIVKRNEEKIVAKIIEVRPNEISYKRFDYQDGPTFILLKPELKYIVYANGVRESYENYVVAKSEYPDKTSLLIQPAKKLYYYHGQLIGEQDMLDIAWKLNDKRINLMVKSTEQKKVLRNSFLIGGIALEAAGFLTFTGIISAYSSTANASRRGHGFRNPALREARMERMRTGGCLILGGLACQVVSVVFKIKETQHAHLVVDLYNKSILQ